MKLTFSIDDRLVQKAQKTAEARGTGLDQLIRGYFEELSPQPDVEAELEELRWLSLGGQGREEAHEQE